MIDDDVVIKDRSSYRLLLRREWYLLGIAWWLAWTILQMTGSLRMRGCCRSEHTRVAERQRWGIQWNYPLLSATYILMHKWLAPYRGSWCGWLSQSRRRNFHCSQFPIRIQSLDWFRHRSIPFHRDFLGWLRSFDRLVLRLIFLCRGTCRCQWWVLQLGHCWGCWWCWHQLLRRSSSRGWWQRSSHCSSCTDRWRRRRVGWHLLPVCRGRGQSRALPTEDVSFQLNIKAIILSNHINKLLN